jgi:hypothetical protein
LCFLFFVRTHTRKDYKPAQLRRELGSTILLVQLYFESSAIGCIRSLENGRLNLRTRPL